MNNIELLKDLTQTTRDSVDGYRKAAEKAEKPALKRALEQRRDNRAQTLSEMNRALINRGEDPVTDESMSRQAHEVFTSITDAFSNDDSAVVSRVEEGEDYIAGKFRDALEDDAKTDPEIRTVIEKAYKDIREGERFTDMLEQQYA
ncbi:MAG: PA2169 family four-helix-bundle protein [Erythrobacter sp.]